MNDNLFDPEEVFLQLSKSVDGEICKALKELTNVGRPSSILKNTIQDLLIIHEHIDAKRREWSDKLRLLCEQAKDKQVFRIFSIDF